MNHFVARAVLRRLISSRPCDRCISTSSSAVAATVSVRSFDEVVVMWRGQGLGFIGGAQWRRSLSTAAERTKAVAGKDHEGSAATDKDRKGGAVADKEEGGGVMVSSYWGVSRPKVIREDGTEWPWNCFMVI